MAGSTNVLIWNPTGANQETDTAYKADSQRSGGATDPSLFDAALANKLFFQATTFLYGLFTAFANKGFSTSDASAPALVAQCANFLTTADVKPSLIYVLFSSSLVFDCSKANGFQVTLSGDATVTLTHAVVGQRILLAFTQDAVGGRTITLPGTIVSPGTISVTANSNNVQEFVVLNDNKLHPVTPMVVS